MKITEVKNCPPGLNYFDKDDLESKLEPQDIEDIVEIFQTPLTGSLTGTIRMQITGSRNYTN